MDIIVKRICYPLGEDSWSYNDDIPLSYSQAHILILTHDLDKVKIVKGCSKYPELEYYKEQLETLNNL